MLVSLPHCTSRCPPRSTRARHFQVRNLALHPKGIETQPLNQNRLARARLPATFKKEVAEPHRHGDPRRAEPQAVLRPRQLRRNDAVAGFDDRPAPHILGCPPAVLCRAQPDWVFHHSASVPAQCRCLPAAGSPRLYRHRRRKHQGDTPGRCRPQPTAMNLRSPRSHPSTKEGQLHSACKVAFGAQATNGHACARSRIREMGLLRPGRIFRLAGVGRWRGPVAGAPAPRARPRPPQLSEDSGAPLPDVPGIAGRAWFRRPRHRPGRRAAPGTSACLSARAGRLLQAGANGPI